MILGVTVKIHLAKGAQMPRYATAGASGADIHALLDEPVVIPILSAVRVPTGIHVEIPEGYEWQIRPRSGLAFKHGIVSFWGTIDSDYRSEVQGLLFNHGPQPYTVYPGDRIAQAVLAEVPRANFVETPIKELSNTDRGTGGLGSTGR